MEDFKQGQQGQQGQKFPWTAVWGMVEPHRGCLLNLATPWVADKEALVQRECLAHSWLHTEQVQDRLSEGPRFH